MTTAILDSISISPIPEVCISIGAESAVQAAGSEFDQGIEAWVSTIFQSHPSLKWKARFIQCRCRNKCLQLFGELPSFYLKQLAQEALRYQCHDFQIDNRIMVVHPEESFKP